jgi:hypothetical protein
VSTRAEPLGVGLEQKLTHDAPVDTKTIARDAPPAWSADRFASEQVRALVSQVFLSRHACRQVLVTAVDASTDVHGLCAEVGRVLSVESGKEVCLVAEDSLEADFRRKSSEPILDYGVAATLRDFSRQISHGFWLLPQVLLCNESSAEFAADVLSRRLDQMRAEFDFAVIQAPAAGCNGMAALLGALTDGVILVIEAHRTRRLAAQKALMNLRATGARLLGTVLIERTFPIPARLYYSV